jgi:hypothetical protein
MKNHGLRGEFGKKPAPQPQLYHFFPNQNPEYAGEQDGARIFLLPLFLIYRVRIS